jgi:SAM-dependent methyltransferase
MNWLRKLHSGLPDSLLSSPVSRLKGTDKKQYVLDVNCGKGGNVARLLSHGKNIVVMGLDPVPSHILAAMDANRREVTQGRCRLVRGTVERLPFAANTFQLVTAIDVMQEWKDPMLAFHQMFRVLDEDGTLVLFRRDEKEPKEEDHYTEDAVSRDLEKAGFADIQVRQHRNGTLWEARKPIRTGALSSAFYISGILMEHVKILMAAAGLISAVLVVLFHSLHPGQGKQE